MTTLERYYRINEATGISIIVLADGNAVINACSVAVQNNQLNFEKKITGVRSLKELTQHFPAKAIVALNLSGKGILQKQTEKIEEINHQNFSSILPNANPNDFYIQNFISGSQSFVSVIRKADADEWIGQLKQLGFEPLMLSLGPFPVQNIISQVNVYGEETIFDGHIVFRNEQKDWTGCHYTASATSPFPLKVASESIDEKLLIPYAAAFQLVMAEKVGFIHADVAALDIAFQQQTGEKKLKVYGVIILCLFFLLLLVNFFLFSSLTSSNEKLTGQVSRSAQSSEDIRNISRQVQQKEALLKSLGWEENINKSSLIDQVASLLPGEIAWTEAAVDPVDLSNTRSQKAVVFFTRRIRISGNSEKIIPVNEWIARIKAKSWVKNVQLDNYTFNNELNTGQFTILIDY